VTVSSQMISLSLYCCAALKSDVHGSPSFAGGMHVWPVRAVIRGNAGQTGCAGAEESAASCARSRSGSAASGRRSTKCREPRRALDSAVLRGRPQSFQGDIASSATPDPQAPAPASPPRVEEGRTPSPLVAWEGQPRWPRPLSSVGPAARDEVEERPEYYA